MVRQQRSMQSVIASLMTEEMGSPGLNQGGSYRSLGTPDDNTDMAVMEIVTADEGNELEEEPEGFTAKELKIAKRFVELMGGSDRAHEALDKVSECEECLDIIDNESPQNEDEMDAAAIEKLAVMMPILPDLPTSAKNNMNLSSLYNPNAVSGAM